MYVPNLRTCWICGVEYKYCEKCDPLHSWKVIACTRQHYQVAIILDEYRNKIIDTAKAVEMFGNIGITLESDFSEYLPEVARDIKNILSEKAANTVALSKTKSEKTTKDK